MKNLKAFLLALAMFFSLLSFGQEKTITGTVSDNSGFLPGVNVVVKGTHRATQTDIDGKYNIKVTVNEILVFSFVGMKEETILVTDSNTINIKMTEDSPVLTEVIPLPFNLSARKKAIEAVATISKEDIEKSMSGKVSGLNIANEKPINQIAYPRGCMPSVKANTNKLYVVDGIITIESFANQIDSIHIKSRIVLDGTSATALYGARGQNGVVIINTQKFSGKERRKFKKLLKSEKKRRKSAPLDLKNGKQKINNCGYC